MLICIERVAWECKGLEVDIVPCRDIFDLLVGDNIRMTACNIMASSHQPHYEAAPSSWIRKIVKDRGNQPKPNEGSCTARMMSYDGIRSCHPLRCDARWR